MFLLWGVTSTLGLRVALETHRKPVLHFVFSAHVGLCVQPSPFGFCSSARQAPHKTGKVCWATTPCSCLCPLGGTAEQNPSRWGWPRTPQCLDVHTAVTLPGSRRKQFGAMGADTITPQALVTLAVFSKPGDNWRLMKPKGSPPALPPHSR